ncbi:hypothetical protein KCP75_13755 [Salmonella enterica subsp. enterica]|nr:hypothetical protein KCP75_13755 [Salmonella enterica subsp. enterica]
MTISPQVEQVLRSSATCLVGLWQRSTATTANRSRAEMNEIRRQWFWLSVRTTSPPWSKLRPGACRPPSGTSVSSSRGQFVAWCKAELATAAGLPDDANELVDMVYQYCRTRGLRMQNHIP